MTWAEAWLPEAELASRDAQMVVLRRVVVGAAHSRLRAGVRGGTREVGGRGMAPARRRGLGEVVRLSAAEKSALS